MTVYRRRYPSNHSECHLEIGPFAMAKITNILIGGLILGAMALAVILRFWGIDGGGPPAPEPSGLVNSAPTASDAAPVPIPEVETEIWRSQRLMRDLGFYDGAVNGVLTAETTDAAIRFQTSRGVPADGKVDHMFIILLEDARRP